MVENHARLIWYHHADGVVAMERSEKEILERKRVYGI
jgi:hypothetical protein